VKRKAAQYQYQTVRRFGLRGARAIQAAGPAPRWVRWLRVGALVTLVLIGAIAAWLTIDERFYILDVNVVGNERTPAEQVCQASELRGLHLFWVHPAQVSDRIVRTLPGVADAHVKCKFPAACMISVMERQPKAMWIDSQQETEWWIGEDGVLFPAGEGRIDEVVVKGPLPIGEDGQLVEPVRNALAALWKRDSSSVPKAFDYVPSRGLVFTDARGFRVILGTGGEMDQRFQILRLLTHVLEARGVRPKYVDVRYPEAPYYSTTNDW